MPVRRLRSGVLLLTCLDSRLMIGISLGLVLLRSVVVGGSRSIG